MEMSGRTKRGLRAPRQRFAAAEAGFTVIEVLIAMTIFMLVLVGLGGVMIGLGRVGRDTRTRTESALFMQEVLEDARVVQYANLVTLTRTKSIGGGVTLQANFTVTEVVSGRLKQVDVRVQRIPANPTSAERAVRVFYANRDP